MNNVPQFVARFSKLAGTPEALSAFAAILWSTTWLAVAIRHGNFWTLDQWSAGPFSELHSLLISLPLVAAMLLTSRPNDSRLPWLFTTYCILSLTISVYLLGSFSSLACCFLSGGCIAAFSLMKSFTEPNTVTIGSAEVSSNTGNEAEVSGSIRESTDQSDSTGEREHTLGKDVEETEFCDNDIEEADDAEEPNDSWIQQWTLRQLADETAESSHQIEWFSRHQWKPDQSSVELHVLFQPPFVKTPELQLELVEGDARLKIADKQPHGVRLELKANKADHTEPVMIWLTATGQLDESK